MGCLSKGLASVLIILMAISSLSLLMVRPGNAQTPLSLPIPEFVVYFVGNTYNVPATVSINPYTGENETVPSHFVTTGTIYLVVTNSPKYIIYPTSINWANGSNLYYFSSSYGFRMKGHFEADNWTAAGGGFTYGNGNADGTFTMASHTVYYYTAESYPPNSQIDFQVEINVSNNTEIPYNPNYINTDYYEVSTLYATSGWSGTQTVTIANSTALPPEGYGGPSGYWGPEDFSTGITASSTTSPITTSSTPAVPELPWLVIVPLLLSVFSVAVMRRWRKVSHREA